MLKNNLRYIGAALICYVAFVVIISYKKDYEAFNGVPFIVWVVALVLLLTSGITDIILTYRKKKKAQDALDEENSITFDELLQMTVLKDKTFSISQFRYFRTLLRVEFNDANYAHIQSLIKKKQTDHFNKDEFTDEHTLEVMVAVTFEAQDNAVYIALFYDPVDYFSNPELLKIYKIS